MRHYWTEFSENWRTAWGVCGARDLAGDTTTTDMNEVDCPACLDKLAGEVENRLTPDIDLNAVHYRSDGQRRAACGLYGGGIGFRVIATRDGVTCARCRASLGL